MKGTIINDKALFDIWCEIISNEVFSTSMVSKDSVKETVKVSILSNLELFIDCIVDRIDHDLIQLIKKAQDQMGSKEYVKTGFKIRQLKLKRRVLQKKKSEEHKKFQDLNRYQQLRTFLLEEGQEGLMEKFYKFKNEQVARGGGKK